MVGKYNFYRVIQNMICENHHKQLWKRKLTLFHHPNKSWWSRIRFLSWLFFNKCTSLVISSLMLVSLTYFEKSSWQSFTDGQLQINSSQNYYLAGVRFTKANFYMLSYYCKLQIKLWNIQSMCSYGKYISLRKFLLYAPCTRQAFVTFKYYIAL